jgi:RNA polymerase sigma-70 factor (ECF subfamily)
MLANLDILDQRLCALLKEGDEKAFASIFNRYQAPLFDFAYKRIRDKDEAKDIVQEIFVRLWNNREELQIKNSLRAYLYRCALNGVLNKVSRQVVREEYVSSLQQMIEGHTREADYHIREADMERLINAEIAALPPKMREVFEMRKTEYLSNKEIAGRMGISEQTVETHMKRALRALRMRLSAIVFLISAFLS